MPRLERAHLGIAAAALASHAACLWAGFIWLDHAHLEQGLALPQSSNWSGLFTHGFAGTGYYRPLMSVSLSLDAALGGAPWLYHLTTLLWHVAAAVLVAVAGEQLGLSQRAARGAGLLFAVHPVTTLVASAIAFRSEAMIAALLLGLITLHLRGKAWASGAVLCAAALTKETALLLAPLFLAALELFPQSGARQPPRWRLWAAEGAALSLALALRLSFAPAWRAHFADLPLQEAIGTRLAAVTKSGLAVLLPLEGGVCDAFPVTPLASPAALAGLAALLRACYLAYRRRGPAILLALALVPSLQLVPVMRWWSPHYVYLPLAFAAMLAAEGLERWGAQAFRLLPPLALLLGGLSYFQTRHFRSDERLWTHEVMLDPTCREAHFYLGDAALGAKRWDEAADHYEQALATTPGVLSYVDQGASLQNLGVARLQQGRFVEARQAFETALERKPVPQTRKELSYNLAAALALGRRAAESSQQPSR